MFTQSDLDAVVGRPRMKTIVPAMAGGVHCVDEFVVPENLETPVTLVKVRKIDVAVGITPPQQTLELTSRVRLPRATPASGEIRRGRARSPHRRDQGPRARLARRPG